MSSPLDDAAEQFEKLLPPMESTPATPALTDNGANGEKAAGESGAAADSKPKGDTVAEAESTQVPEPPPSPCRRLDHAKHGYDLELTVGPDQVVEAVKVLERGGFAIDMVSGVDWPDDEQMEVIYDFYHPQGPFRVAVRSRIPRDNPEIPTVSTVFPGALWHERETYEFYGIKFTGHPNLIHLLLPEDMEGYPLRKDFKMPAEETPAPPQPETETHAGA